MRFARTYKLQLDRVLTKKGFCFGLFFLCVCCQIVLAAGRTTFLNTVILVCGQQFVIVFKKRKLDIFRKLAYCCTELWFCREHTCLSVSLDLFHVHWKTKRRLTNSVYFHHLYNLQMCWRHTKYLYTNLFLQFSVLIGYFCLLLEFGELV